MERFDDPATMSPAARLQEVAALLAEGYRRHRRAGTRTLSPAKSDAHVEPPVDPHGGNARALVARLDSAAAQSVHGTVVDAPRVARGRR